jgi:hypothetical protein
MCPPLILPFFMRSLSYQSKVGDEFLPERSVCFERPCGARSNVISRGTMLQAGRSRICVPMRSLDFFQFPLIFPAALWPWGRLSL